MYFSISRAIRSLLRVDVNTCSDVVTLDATGAPVYRSFWAFTDQQEQDAFEAVIDLIVASLQIARGDARVSLRAL